LDEGVCGRTINIELGGLSRAIGKKWAAPLVRRSLLIGLFVRIALLTGMRSGEIWDFAGARWISANE
jgi:hypothetical protein